MKKHILVANIFAFLLIASKGMYIIQNDNELVYNLSVNRKFLNDYVIEESSTRYSILDSIETTTENVIQNSSIFVNNYTLPATYNKVYTHNYFKNLHTNIPNNQYGSCGYVALGMYLSFWDSYWNDNIISEQYDEELIIYHQYDNLYTSSPGVKFDEYEDSSIGLSQEHINFNYLNWHLQEGISNYFQSYLFSLGVKSYSDSNLGTESLISYKENDETCEGFGVGYSTEVKLINRFIYENNLSDKFSLVSYHNSEITKYNYEHRTYEYFEALYTVENPIRNFVNQGIPVMVGGSINNWNGGHLIIVYDVDDDENLIGNFGWGYGSTAMTLESQQFVPTDYYVLVPNEYAFDANNNNYHNVTNSTYYSAHDLNSHVHNYFYEYYDYIYHLKKCSCGCVLEKHDGFICSLC